MAAYYKPATQQPRRLCCWYVDMSVARWDYRDVTLVVPKLSSLNWFLVPRSFTPTLIFFASHVVFSWGTRSNLLHVLFVCSHFCEFCRDKRHRLLKTTKFCEIIWRKLMTPRSVFCIQPGAMMSLFQSQSYRRPKWHQLDMTPFLPGLRQEGRHSAVA